MRKAKRTEVKEGYECETCGKFHENKYEIFQCPEHGEFCNDWGSRWCCLFRYNDKMKRDIACCPICGWSMNDELHDYYDGDEDTRKGDIPRTGKEEESFKREREFLMNDPHNNSGHPAFKRIKAEEAMECQK